MSDHDRGIEFGGSNSFKIRQGGTIRESFPVEATTVFSTGGAVELNDDGEIEVASATSADKLVGISATDRGVVGDENRDETIGSGKATIVLDPCVVETVELASGVSFAVNDKIYQAEDGTWTNAVGGLTDTRVFGTALNAVVGGGTDILKMRFEAQGPA